MRIFKKYTQLLFLFFSPPYKIMKKLGNVEIYGKNFKNTVLLIN